MTNDRKNVGQNLHVFTILLCLFVTQEFSIFVIFQGNWDQVCESFDDMNLKEKLLRGIYSYGFEKPSAIQQRAIVPCTMSMSIAYISCCRGIASQKRHLVTYPFSTFFFPIFYKISISCFFFVPAFVFHIRSLFFDKFWSDVTGRVKRIFCCEFSGGIDSEVNAE